METWKIAVINDGKNILPFSFEAMATVYEFNRYENSLRETGESFVVEDLIEFQKANYTADYPIDPEEPVLEKNRIRYLICGSISPVLCEALYNIRMCVEKNIRGSMKDFPRIFLADCFERYNPDSTDKPGFIELCDLVRITGPDEKQLMHFYRSFGFELTAEQKLYLLDEWAGNRDEWEYFDIFIKLFNIVIDIKRARKYARCFSEPGKMINGYRDKDFYDIQRADLFHLILLSNNIASEDQKRFYSYALMRAAENRLILFAEFLMDQGAEIYFTALYDGPAATVEGLMADNTMRAYLDYYRDNGRKMSVDTQTFFKDVCGLLVYTP